MTVSIRSALSAGLAAGLVATAGSAVISAPGSAPPIPTVASPAIELSAVVSANVGTASNAAGDALINAYYVIQPWVQYGFELGAWAASWLPWPIGLLGQQVNIAYSGIQPLSEAVVFSLAYLINGQFDLIGPTLSAGIQTSVNNVIQGEVNWVLSFFPPLPPLPFPIFPGAAVAPRKAGAVAGRQVRAVAARSGVGPAAGTTESTDGVTSGPADVPSTADATAPVAEPQSRGQVSRSAVGATRAVRATAAARQRASAATTPGPTAANSTLVAERSAGDATVPRSARATRSAR